MSFVLAIAAIGSTAAAVRAEVPRQVPLTLANSLALLSHADLFRDAFVSSVPSVELLPSVASPNNYLACMIVVQLRTLTTARSIRP